MAQPVRIVDEDGKPIDATNPLDIALKSGTALVGKVGIDQVTANANEVVVKTLAAPASLPLPTGAATAAKQLPDGHAVTVDNAVDAGVYDAMEGSFSTLFKELEREEKQNPDFLWNPLDAQPMVDQLSQLYAGPILEAWYRRWQNFSPPPCRPNLRLLNQLWYADPPIIDRLT